MKLETSSLVFIHLIISYIQGGGGLSLYYSESRQAHEHHPTVPAQFKYLEHERQWLLIEDGGSKIAFLR